MDCTQTEENIRTLSAAIARLAIFRNELLTRPLGKLSELLRFADIGNVQNAADALSALTSERVFMCRCFRKGGRCRHSRNAA